MFTVTQRSTYSLLLIRIMLGITMLLHGLQKWVNLGDVTDFLLV